MHDLVDAYCRSVAAAVAAAREKRAQAARLFDEAMGHIPADFEVDVAAAGAALDAGMTARFAALRGENKESEVTPPESVRINYERTSEVAPDDAPPERPVVGGDDFINDELQSTYAGLPRVRPTIIIDSGIATKDRDE